ncbi:hypothetical protein [Halorubrum sp. Atlit-26R]|uniref:hypothetical protein n=1 Tax=Halorubrum sp. Atlit-26R TaxID=2282128 RepID=UPI001F249F7F|nr:hypothetical protein [Halorubrum sp. Atlit-26R]
MIAVDIADDDRRVLGDHHRLGLETNPAVDGRREQFRERRREIRLAVNAELHPLTLDRIADRERRPVDLEPDPLAR